MLPNDDLHRRQLAKLYESYNDNALLDIAEEDLTDVARAVLREEIASRGLENAAEMRLRQEEATALETERIVVWAGRTIAEATIVIYTLRLANIEATLVPVQSVSPSQRFQVNVAALDAENALGLVSMGVSNAAAEEILADFVKAEVILPPCPSCDSDQVKLEGSRAGNCWSCESCGKQWEEDPIGLAESTTGDRKLPLLTSSEDPMEGASGILAKNRRRQVVNRLTVSLVLISSVLAIVTAWPTSWTWMRIVGLVLWVVGAITWTAARLQLGSSFTGKAEARELVTTGIYARIENPIYISGALVISGICLYFSEPWALFLVLITVLVQIRRIGKERAVLAEAFGARYAEYRSRTWF